MIFIAILAAVSAVAPAPKSAEDPYWEYSGWYVFKNKENCSMLRSYEGGTSLYVSYTLRTQRSWIVLTDPAFKSVTNDNKYSVKLYFRKGDYFDDGWGAVPSSGVTPGDDKGFAFVLKGNEALVDFATSDAISFYRSDDILISALKLDGSKLAVEKLRQCATEVDATNPADPLAGFEEKKK